MTTAPERFRDQLLDAEPVTPAYRQRYEKEMEAMLEQRLTRARRWAYGLGAVVSLALGVLFGAIAVVAGDLHVLGRVMFAVGAAFWLAEVALLGSIARAGRLDLAKHPAAMAGMAWGIAILMLVLVMVGAAAFPDPIRAVQAVANGLVFLVMAAVGMVFHRIDRTERKTREKLLEIELRLAELAETLAREAQPPAPADES